MGAAPGAGPEGKQAASRTTVQGGRSTPVVLLKPSSQCCSKPGIFAPGDSVWRHPWESQPQKRVLWEEARDAPPPLNTHTQCGKCPG